MDELGSIRCDRTSREGCTVVRLRGQLTPTTYVPLRDILLELAMDQPRAVIADIRGLSVGTASALSVFTSVWMQVGDWPGVPIALVADTHRQGSLLAASTIRRYLPVHDTVHAAVDNVDQPPLRRRAHLDLPASGTSSAGARQYVTDTCARWGVPEVTANAVSVATELVENSVQHAGTPLRLRLELRDGLLTVAVSDGSRTQAVPREPEATGRSHNGLHIVATIARVWGCAPEMSGGKVVWAVLPTAQRPFQALLS